MPSDSHLTSEINQKRRVKTGCKECRTRRVKCSEGGRSPSGVRYPCRQCTKRSRSCCYPSNVGSSTTEETQWVAAADAPAELTTITWDDGSESQASTQFPTTSVSLLHNTMFSINSGQTGHPFTANTLYPSILDPPPRSGEYQDTLFCGQAYHTPLGQSSGITGIWASTSRKGPSENNDLSPRLRISQFDGCLVNPDDTATMSYLFSGNIKDIGVYGISQPQQDNFQRHLLPFLAHQLTQKGKQDRQYDFDLLYNAAMRLSIAHWGLATGQFALANQRASFYGSAGGRALAKIRQGPRTELSLVAQTIYILGSFYDASFWDLQIADMEASLESSLGHHAYDVMCVYHTQYCITRGLQPQVFVSRAGGIDLDRTFGVSRQMWALLGQAATLLAQAKALKQLVGNGDNGALIGAGTALLGDFDSALMAVRAKVGECRAQLGTELHHLALSILVRCEVLHESPSSTIIQQLCESVHEVFDRVPAAESLVGCDFPLYIAACFSYHREQRHRLLADCQLISVRRTPHLATSNGGIVPDAAWDTIERSLDMHLDVPWREALVSAGRSIVF